MTFLLKWEVFMKNLLSFLPSYKGRLMRPTWTRHRATCHTFDVGPRPWVTHKMSHCVGVDGVHTPLLNWDQGSLRMCQVCPPATRQTPDGDPKPKPSHQTPLSEKKRTTFTSCVHQGASPLIKPPSPTYLADKLTDAPCTVAPITTLTAALNLRIII